MAQWKTCTKCKVTKKINEFTVKMTRCKVCRRADVQKWRDENPEKVKAMTASYTERSAANDKRRRVSRYGLTPDEYDKIMTEETTCHSCGRADDGRSNGRLVLDHHHGRGKYRGVLCDGCNKAAGHVNDDPETLRRLADYLEERS